MASGVLILLFCGFSAVFSLPEQGVWDMKMDQTQNLAIYTKSMYNNSQIAVKIVCDAKDETEVTLLISWVLRMTECAEEYLGIDDNKQLADTYYTNPGANRHTSGSGTYYKESKETQRVVCGQHSVINLPHEFVQEKRVDFVYNDTTWASTTTSTTTSSTVPEEQEEGKKEGKEEGAVKEKKETTNVEQTDKNKEESPKKDEQKVTTTTTTTKQENAPTTKTKRSAGKSRNKREEPKLTKDAPVKKPMNEMDQQVVVTTNRDGIYLFMLKIDKEEGQPNAEYNIDLSVWMKGPQGYLSAIEWPLLPFYGVMCLVYVVYGIIWLVFSALNWRDLLRIQFWIGAVILLGMLEKAVFFAEYESINATGRSVQGAVVFAELVSCLKRTLARMLVIIVSLGFGIVKPRLGADQNKVVGCGILYFVLGSVEGCLRVVRHKSDQRQALMANIPLSVLDAAICWWVFTSLVQTTRTLRLRRNVVKLSLYRHFTNTLVFAVIASVAYMIWSIKQHRLAQCISDWKEIWVDEAFWHLLFSIILFVIMILWRPTINNQRYAFSPLLDAADDDDEDEMPLNDAFEGMKMRQKEGDGSKLIDRKNKTEDDLKWIEENIPASVTDTALPSLLDSDEEIVTTKFEMSKME